MLRRMVLLLGRIGHSNGEEGLHSGKKSSGDLMSPTIAALTPLVPNLIALRLATRQAHWAVRGPRFAMLHEFFDDMGAELDGWTDRVAERLTTLGGLPMGTLEAAAVYSTLSPFALQPGGGDEMLVRLHSIWSDFLELLAHCVSVVSTAGDLVSENMLVELQEHVELTLWHLDAHQA